MDPVLNGPEPSIRARTHPYCAARMLNQLRHVIGRGHVLANMATPYDMPPPLYEREEHQLTKQRKHMAILRNDHILAFGMV